MEFDLRPTFRAPLVRAALATTLLALLSGCRPAIQAFGTDAASARTNADALALALEHRFTRVDRAPKFANARLRIARYALAPSKLVDDTAVWTSMSSTRTGPQRMLDVGASFTNNRFFFQPRTAVSLPQRVGDERHRMELTQLGKDDYEWVTEVDHAVGPMPPQRMEDVARAIFASMERPGNAVRADYRAALPRTTAALGRLIIVDSLNAVPQPDGSTAVTAHLLVRSEGLKASFPNFAKYVDKYVEPARYHLRLADNTGALYFDANSGTNERLVIRFRSRNGELLPLAGGSRAMSDTLVLHVDAKAKFGMFTVGVSKMQGEFVHVDNGRERGWAMRFSREPQWHLPLIAERLLRTPLRRPFEGRGVQFRIGFRTGDQGQTLLSRNLQVTVRESAIMRFLGNLGFGAMSDFAGKVEEEENRFITEVLSGLRADLRAL